jgi:hypothetical protein
MIKSFNVGDFELSRARLKVWVFLENSIDILGGADAIKCL